MRTWPDANCSRRTAGVLGGRCTAILWVLAGCLVLMAACLSGCGSSGVAAPPAGAVATTGTVTGYLFTPAGADAGAPLEQTTVIAATPEPPTGMKPLNGAVLSIENTTVGVTTGADGRFTLQNVPAGPQALLVAAEGKTGTWRLTVVAARTLRLGTAKMTREQAFQMLQDAGELPSPESTLVAGSQQPLPAGTILSTEDASEFPHYHQTTVARPAWLFLVDPYCLSGFAHPVKHVLVDDATGEVTAFARSYWPRLNDIDIWRPLGQRAGPDMLHEPTQLPDVQPRYSALAPMADIMQAVGPRDHIPECEGGESEWWSICIAGTNEEAFRWAALNMYDALPAGHRTYIKPGPSATFGAVYRPVFDDYNSRMKPCDTFFLYMATHAGVEGEADDSSAWGVSPAKADGDVPNGEIMFKRTDESLGQQQSQWLTPQNFLLSRVNACHIIVVIDMCYAGKTLEAAQQFFPRQLKNLTGRAAVVITSTDVNAQATFRIPGVLTSLGVFDPGSLFGNEIIAKGLAGLAPSALETQFKDIVGRGDAPVAKEQAAKLWVRPIEEGETCIPPTDAAPDEVTGKLTTAAGEPIAGHSVVIYTHDPDAEAADSSVGTRWVSLDTKSNAAGRYTFSSVPVGEYRIVPALAPAGSYWDPSGRDIIKKSGRGIDGQDFVRRQAGKVALTVPVIGADGKPMADVTVKLDHSSGLIYRAWTCALGMAVFTDISPGHCVLTVEVPAAPSGFQWVPPLMEFDLGAQDLTTDPFQLLPM